MNPIITFFVWLWSVLTFPIRWLFDRGALLQRQRFYRAQTVEDLPDKPDAGWVYLAGEPGKWWAASMLCPCGCNADIQLNLLQQVRPRWTADIASDGAVTLTPSVWRQSGCRSHFILRNGRIVWC